MATHVSNQHLHWSSSADIWSLPNPLPSFHQRIHREGTSHLLDYGWLWEYLPTRSSHLPTLSVPGGRPRYHFTASTLLLSPPHYFSSQRTAFYNPLVVGIISLSHTRTHTHTQSPSWSQTLPSSLSHKYHTRRRGLVGNWGGERIRRGGEESTESAGAWIPERGGGALPRRLYLPLCPRQLSPDPRRRSAGLPAHPRRCWRLPPCGTGASAP